MKGDTKFRKKFIKDPIFGRNFWFCIGDDFEFFDFVRNKNGYEVNLSEEVDAKNVFDGKSYYLWIRKPDLSNFLHELKHQCYNSLRDIGIPYDDSTDEVHAYYFQFKFQECYKFLNETPLK